MQSITFTACDLATLDDGEPRIRDLALAERLGMRDAHKIRALILGNLPELAAHGGISARRAENTGRRGRPGAAYYLNEGQALVICALSRTPAAAAVRKALIDVFMAYRRGELKTVHVDEHWRRPPVRRQQTETIDVHGRFVSFFKAFHDQPEALADWACAYVNQVALATRSFTGIR